MTTSGVILLAEDDRRMRTIYTDVLEASGYNVVSACDGAEALELLNRVKPKLIILDVMMPNLDGIETCRRLRKMFGKDVPVMFLTALDQLGTVRECIAAGGDDYIMKSESVVTIVQRVGHWMNGTPRRKPPAARQDTSPVEVAAEGAAESAAEGVAEISREAIEAPLSSETDENVRKISEFLREARANASEGFGKTLNEKLYLFGYVTGVVEHWAQSQSALDERFFDYLDAILNETGILEAGEVSEMLSGFSHLSDDTCFGIGRAHGRNDPAQKEIKGETFVPIGLEQFQLLAGF